MEKEKMFHEKTVQKGFLYGSERGHDIDDVGALCHDKG